MISRPPVSLLIVLVTALSVAADRAEELAFDETAELLGDPPQFTEIAEPFSELVLTTGSRFIEQSYAAQSEILGESLFPERRTHLVRISGGLSTELDGRAELVHALELEPFAYSLRADYGAAETAVAPRRGGGARLRAGWLGAGGDRLILDAAYDGWGYEHPDFDQRQERWRTDLWGVWRPTRRLTTYARLGGAGLEQTGTRSAAVDSLSLDAGLRLFLGSDDYLRFDAGYLAPLVEDAPGLAACELSNTFTLDRVLFITAGVGLAHDGEPHLTYDGAARLLLGPLSLISVVAVRRAERPDPPREDFAVAGLGGLDAAACELSEDYYLEYSLHFAETSIAGVRGGLRFVDGRRELTLVEAAALDYATGPPRELLTGAVFLDYSLPPAGWGGRLRLSYELADPKPPWFEAPGDPPPHQPVHRAELALELQPLDALGGRLEALFTGERQDGAGGNLAAQTELNLALEWRIDEHFGLTLFVDNLLDQRLYDNALAPRGPLAAGLRASVSW